MILALDVCSQLRRVEVHLAQTPGAVPLRLVVEVRGRWMPALAARRHRTRAHAFAELHRRHEAVATGALP